MNGSITTLERVSELLDAMEIVAEYERGFEHPQVEQSINTCIELCDLYDMYIVDGFSIVFKAIFLLGAGLSIAIAIKFLEYMASDAAQNIIANANYEFPAVASVSTTPELKALGSFKIDPLNVSVYGQNQAQAQAIFDRAGWR